MSLTTYGTKIDLRDIPPRDRQALIRNTCRVLEPGQTMELLDDSDPQALCNQLQEQLPGGFGWNRLQSGPTIWRVRITRVTKAENG